MLVKNGLSAILDERAKALGFRNWANFINCYVNMKCQCGGDITIGLSPFTLDKKPERLCDGFFWLSCFKESKHERTLREHDSSHFS